MVCTHAYYMKAIQGFYIVVLLCMHKYTCSSMYACILYMYIIHGIIEAEGSVVD